MFENCISTFDCQTQDYPLVDLIDLITHYFYSRDLSSSLYLDTIDIIKDEYLKDYTIKHYRLDSYYSIYELVYFNRKNDFFVCSDLVCIVEQILYNFHKDIFSHPEDFDDEL